MNYFFVFQNKSYLEERKGAFLWAPQKNRKGQTFHHWEDMKLIKKGDIIFNSYNGEMKSIIVANENCKEMQKPKELNQVDLWEKDGWYVNCTYHDLKYPIVYKEFMEEILNKQDDKYAPFNKVGRGNTGYLFRVSTQLAEFLLNVIEQRNGSFNINSINTKDFIIEVESNLPYNIQKTEREQIIKQRVGQSIFKKLLLKIERKCKLCGVSNEKFLIASHIKPWSKSSDIEKLDPNNGFLFCPNHDKLFDRGFISFNLNGEIIISRELDENSKIFLNVNENYMIQMNEEQSNYMNFHRENIFEIEKIK
ncbi:HNH endonuclease [Gottfriedia acidiceleris]|uniref:HNH endonuclease n=1 Tax=Gottfriedia acidiceleris TaxID=371036 RepID=UPI00101CA45A|nr:HNH endonuclease [Gottfriedia acidiceleris]